MSLPPDKVRCNGTVRGHAGWPSRCLNRGKVVTSDGKRWCAIHDPVAVKRKRDERDRAIREKLDRATATHARMHAVQQLHWKSTQVLRAIVTQGVNSENLRDAHDVLDKLNELESAQ